MPPVHASCRCQSLCNVQRLGFRQYAHYAPKFEKSQNSFFEKSAAIAANGAAGWQSGSCGRQILALNCRYTAAKLPMNRCGLLSGTYGFSFAQDSWANFIGVLGNV